MSREILRDKGVSDYALDLREKCPERYLLRRMECGNNACDCCSHNVDGGSE